MTTSLLALACLSINSTSFAGGERSDPFQDPRVAARSYPAFALMAQPDPSLDLPYLRITRSSSLFAFRLPDGSKAQVNSQNEVWVTEKLEGLDSSAIRWVDYAKKQRLNIKVMVETGDVDGIHLSIPRMGKPFLLPGGFEVHVNGADETWVLEPGGPGYPATRFQNFAEKVGFPVTPIIRYNTN